MAIIPDPAPSTSRPKPGSKPKPDPFTFWFYFTVTISLITATFISISSLSKPDPKAWFMSLPTSLRSHYNSGRVIKVQVSPNEPQFDVFSYSKGVKSNENVVIIHGLGCSSFSFRGIVDGLAKDGYFSVAIDVPGSGFSDKAVEREEERVLGVFGRFFEVFEEIKEKGIFWGFDRLIEEGHLPYDELSKPERRVFKESVEVGLELGGDEVGRVVGQVVEAMGLAPFHLVLHDSGLVMMANWVAENSGLVRSVTLLDSLPKEVALPLRVLEVPLVREVVLRVGFVFGKLMRSVGGLSVEEDRVLLEGRGGRKAVVGMGRKLNRSLDLGEWVSRDGMKSVPMQVLWSGSLSEEWIEEGKRVAEVVSARRFIRHSGGRWPQDDTSNEIAEQIFSFVSSLPETERKAGDEPLPEHIQEMLDEAKAKGHHSHHDGDDPGSGAQAGYMDAYGLGHGQGHGHGWGM